MLELQLYINGEPFVRTEICRLCKRLTAGESVYCTYHDKAYIQIKNKYPDWKYAFANMSWERYLETIIGLKEIGDLAKAVATEELRLVRNR